MKFGEPITTEQATWAILLEIKSPIVGNLKLDGEVWRALEHCLRDEVFRCLSSGEQRLVRLAKAVHSANDSAEGGSVAVLGAIDHTLRRKVWLILGYLYLGRDVDRDWPDWDLEFPA